MEFIRSTFIVEKTIRYDFKSLGLLGAKTCVALSIVSLLVMISVYGCISDLILSKALSIFLPCADVLISRLRDGLYLSHKAPRDCHCLGL